MFLVKTTKDFSDICQKLQQEKILFLDTEFYRRTSYYAKLSLIQIAYGNEKIIIDALEIKDLSAIKEVLFNEKIIKVWHSPVQDFEILFHLFGDIPKNVFDTQIAAYVCGIDNNLIGYGRLCKEILDVDIDKTHQQANWLKRPLDQELLDYAIKDVIYLEILYKELTKIMDTNDYWPKYKKELAKILKVNSYAKPITRVLKKIRYLEQSEQDQKIIKDLVSFREECAMEFDVPRNFLISNKDLIKISKNLPGNMSELRKLKISSRFMRDIIFKEKLLALCLGLKESS